MSDELQPRRELTPEEEAVLEESEAEFSDVYSANGVMYCGMCDQPLSRCYCFEGVESDDV